MSASSLAVSANTLTADKAALSQSLDHITAKESALAYKEKDIAKSLGEVQKNTGEGVKKSYQAVEKKEEYVKAKADYEKLAEEKQELFEKQQEAHKKSLEIAEKDKQLSELEQSKNNEKIAKLKQEEAEQQKDLDRMKASKEKADAEGDNKHEKAYEHSIASKEAALDKKAAEISAAEASAKKANEAADQQKAENAQAVAASCPEICGATKLTVKGDSKTRGVLLDVSPGQSNKILNIISASKAGLDKNIVEPPVEIISAYMEGHCDKGKPSISPNSGSAGKYVREEADAHCPSMLVKEGVTNIGMPGTEDSPLRFRAFCPDPPGGIIDDWGYLLSNILMPQKSKFNTYVIESKGCDGSYPLTATVQAFPKIKASIDLGLTYKCIRNESDIPKFNAPAKKEVTSLESKDGSENGKKVVHVDNWEISIDLKGKADHIALGAQLQVLDPSELLKGLRESITIFLYLFDLIMMDAETAADTAFGGKSLGKDVGSTDSSGKKWDKVSSTGSGKIGLRYPKLGLTLSYENTETDGNTTLDYKMSAEIKADPLIGVGMEINILTALVKIGMNALLPGSPTVLEKGKQFAEFIWDVMNDVTDKKTPVEATKKNIEDRDFYLEAGLSIVMKLGASLGCGAKWERDFGEADGKAVEDETTKKGNYSVASNASLDFLLEGKVYVKGSLLMVKFEAGLMVALGSAKSDGAAKLEFKLDLITVGGKPTVTGGVEWNGLAIIFASYWEAGIKHKDNADTTENELNNGFGGPSTTETALKQVQNKTHYQWVLVEPGKYPPDPEIELDKYAKL